MKTPTRLNDEGRSLSRRAFVQLSAAGAAAIGGWPSAQAQGATEPNPARHPAITAAIEALEPYFTSQPKFRDVSRGQPFPHTLSDETKSRVGLTRETWKCEVVSDPDHPATLRRPMQIKNSTALDFAALLKLADKHAVRFAKTMTCLNIGCPLGTGLWEGVPLREVVWLTQPRENLRRVFYHGYHNDDPKQMFRSSLPIDRVLEDPPGLPPVILC
jgi:DMSO/TMAO reductase YedYZ molybdopterin-dependent catalytic subunit